MILDAVANTIPVFSYVSYLVNKESGLHCKYILFPILAKLKYSRQDSEDCFVLCDFILDLKRQTLVNGFSHFWERHYLMMMMTVLEKEKTILTGLACMEKIMK